VTERWKITQVAAGGGAAAARWRKGIEVTFTVDDPGAFTMPWGAMMRYRNEKGGIENSSAPRTTAATSTTERYAMPEAKTPDF
jgi:hypothetical protein